MWALCPMSTPGRPGTLTPVTDRPGADRAAWYQIDGTVWGRCGSPASIDTRPATRGPFAAQALLSGPWCTEAAGVWARIAAAAVASAREIPLAAVRGRAGAGAASA